jgi:hypothetical protein
MVTTAKVIPLVLRLRPVRREGDRQACEVPSFVLDLRQVYRQDPRGLRVLSQGQGPDRVAATRSPGSTLCRSDSLS